MTTEQIVAYLKAYDAKGRAREQAYWDNEYDGDYAVENIVSVDKNKYSNAVVILFTPYDNWEVYPGEYEASHNWTFVIRDDHKSYVYFRQIVRYPSEKTIVSDNFVQKKELWKQLTRTYGGSANFNDLELTEEKIDDLLRESAQISIKEDNISYREA